MRIFSTILTIILFLACNSDQPKQLSYQDSIRQKNLRDLIYIKAQFDSIVTTDSVMNVEIHKKEIVIDSLINRSMDYKETIIQSQYLSMAISNIKKDRIAIVRRNDSIIRSNEILKLELDQVSRAMQDERESKRIAISQRNELQNKLDKATKAYVTGLQAIGIGYTNPLFGKPKEIETYQHRSVKKIKVYFSLPYNPIAKYEEKHIKALVFSTNEQDIVEKDSLITYNGNEQKISLILQVKDVKAGSHRVDIYINDKLQAQTNLIIK